MAESIVSMSDGNLFAAPPRKRDTSLYSILARCVGESWCLSCSSVNCKAYKVGGLLISKVYLVIIEQYNSWINPHPRSMAHTC